jgi:PIN domain-containing protein
MDMKLHYILIDYENVQVKSLALLKGDHFRVRVFLGPKNTRLATELVLAMKELGERADYIVLEAGGHNALDFHITYYLGRLAAADPAGSFYIISKDTGFDSLIKHINKCGIHCERVISIDTLPCLDKLALSVKAAPITKEKPVTKKRTQELVELVLVNLTKRKAAAPRTEKTLRSTIKSVSGAKYSDKEIDAVFNRLVTLKYVVMEGGRISYNLSAA